MSSEINRLVRLGIQSVWELAASPLIGLINRLVLMGIQHVRMTACPVEIAGRRRNWRRSDKAKFSLVELLVVIAIISILASLLLPALNTAKGVATQTLCMNNQKSLSTQAFMYSQDYGYCLPISTSSNAASMEYTWQYILLRYNRDPNPNLDNGYKSHFKDPSGSFAPGKEWYKWRLDYLYNGFLGATNAWPDAGYDLDVTKVSEGGNTPMRPTQTQYPSIVIMFTDAKTCAEDLIVKKYSWDGSSHPVYLSYFWSNVIPVHNGNSVTSFLDGHVVSRKQILNCKTDSTWLFRPVPYPWWTGDHWGM